MIEVMFQLKVTGKLLTVATVCVMFQMRVATVCVMFQMRVATVCVMFQMRVAGT